MRIVRLLLAGGLLALVAAIPAGAANRQVYIRDAGPDAGRFEAAPGSSSANINQGDTVYWANQDNVAHNATGQGWGTGTIPPGGEASETFNTPGDFPYQCTIHPSMTGSLRVNAVSTTSPPPVTAAPMQPPPTARPTATTRVATATTRRLATATTVAGATTTIPSDFAALAPTTTEASTTSTSGQIAINEDDDSDGGSNAGVIAALAVGLAAVLGGGAYALARLRRTP